MTENEKKLLEAVINPKLHWHEDVEPLIAAVQCERLSPELYMNAVKTCAMFLQANNAWDEAKKELLKRFSSIDIVDKVRVDARKLLRSGE